MPIDRRCAACGPVGHFGKRRRQALAREIEGGAVEVFFACDLEADGVDARSSSDWQDDGMMIAFLDAAQIERVRVLVGDQIAEAIDIEGARSGEIAHAEFDVAGAHDIERRREIGRADRHV